MNDYQTAKPRNRARTLPSIVGESHGLLRIVDERRVKDGLGKSLFQVKAVCVCGTEKWVEERSVRRGLVVSCGRCANKTHGGSKTPEYAVWRSMLARCTNPNHKAYANYGGRGITVCAEWLVFDNFFRDMGAQPFRGASIDRIDNNSGYYRENCRWTNATTQARNRRTNRVICIDGVTRPVAEWAAISGVRHNTICYRLSNGWRPKDAVFTTPNFTNRINGDC